MAYTYKDGRVWVQTKKFEPFKLLLPYGMTDVTDPVGTLTAVREPDPGKRRATVVTDIIRGEPGLPGFSIETRLFRTLNYMLGLRTRRVNFQCHMGSCDRPDNYNASEIALDWEEVLRSDLSIDRTAIIEGDDAPDAVTVPWMAQAGPNPIDFKLAFTSAKTIAETEAILDMAFILEECDDISEQGEPGDVGYAVTEALSGSPTNVANVWFTTNKGEAWAQTTQNPFVGGEDITGVVVLGPADNHRVIVCRGTTDAGNPAEIAYADCTTAGTTAWVNANVGSVDGQYILHLFAVDWGHIFAVTDDGYVYLSKDGGATWTAKLTTGSVQLNESAWQRDGVGYVVGHTNTIYMSEDFGDNWTVLTGPTAEAGNNALTTTIARDGTVYVGYSSGGQYGSYNEGTSWSALPPQGITPTAIKRIRNAPGLSNVIYSVATIASGAGRVLRSTDGGAQFYLWELGIPTNSGINALFVVNPNFVYVGGEPQGGSAFISKATSQIVGTI